MVNKKMSELIHKDKKLLYFLILVFCNWEV